MLSDRYGRVKTMIITLLAYSLFSGLSGFAHSGIEFLLWRLLFGLGVGGMFGAATTLVAESVPPHFRTVALGALQALSAFGNMLASALSLGIVPGKENLWGHYSGWQVLAFISVLPALMAIPMALFLKEPESWLRAKREASSGGTKRSVGSLGDLFNNPRWRKNLSVGVCLGVAGMVGLWGIAFFSPELVTTALKNRPLRPDQFLQPNAIVTALNKPATPGVERIKSGLSPTLVSELARSSGSPSPPGETISDLVKELNGMIAGPSLYDSKAFPLGGLKKATQNLVTLVEENGKRQNISFLNRQLIEQSFPGMIQEQQQTIDKMRSRGTLLQDVGSLLGMVAFTFVAARFSRRGAFLGAFILCFVVVAFVFTSLRTATDVYWMLPLMGFATLSVFAGYSIYFPELFPT
ncbi:MAG: MFS transporter, partial [Limisphaerales bacterium]